MPTFRIDDRELTVPEGTTVLQAALANGVEIPHYCYHPGLSVAGNCRICLVEVEKNPRPQIACYVQAAEGMVVATQSPLAREACTSGILIEPRRPGVYSPGCRSVPLSSTTPRRCGPT